MKANVKVILAMVLVLGGITAHAQATDSNFIQSQVTAIRYQESLIRRGQADGSIDKDLCVYFVQSLQEMKKNGSLIAATTGEKSQVSQLASAKTMSVTECK